MGDRKLRRLDINPERSLGLPKVGRKKRPETHEKASEHHWRERSRTKFRRASAGLQLARPASGRVKQVHPRTHEAELTAM